MQRLFESFGTVQVLTVVLLLQLFVLHAIVTGRIVRIFRLLVLLPALALIVFFFFSAPNRLNPRAEKLNAPAVSSSETAAIEKQSADEPAPLFTVGSVPKKKRLASKNDFLFPLGDLHLSGERGVAAQSPTFTDSRSAYSPVSAEMEPVSGKSSASGRFIQAADERPTPIPLNRSAADSSAAAAGSGTNAATPSANATETSIKINQSGEISAPAQPLATPGGLTAYSGSQGSLGAGGAIQSTEYSATPSETPNIRPTGFQAGPGMPTLKLPENFEITPDTSRRLMENLSETIRTGVEQTKSAVVHIEAKVKKQGISGKKEVEETGAGIIVKTRLGHYVITCNHVAGNAVSNDGVRIVLSDGRIVHPTAVYPCPDYDIAVMKLAEEKNLQAAALGDSDKVHMIDTVMAVGSPFGLEGSVTSGIVSGRLRRRVPNGNRQQIQDFLQTDAAINPGNSGGPLLNTRGQVIGLVTAIMSNSGGSEGVAFAIPINNVTRVAEQLILNGSYRRPYLGVELDDNFTPEKKAKMGLFRKTISRTDPDAPDRLVGTRILGVKAGSPADQAGLKEGDVILVFNGKTVEDDEHFYHLIGLSNVNDMPSVVVLRGSSRLELRPKLIAAGEK